jgi:hypothetical protein
MKALTFWAVAATAVGATSALAQTPQEAPPNPTITQNEATTPSAEQPNDERKARMPMRREQPIVPDTTAPANEGAGAGTSGSDTSTTADTPTTTPTTGEAEGAPGNQPAGAETSDRTPEETTPTPATQVDKTKEGETSTRTPKK